MGGQGWGAALGEANNSKQQHVVARGSLQAPTQNQAPAHLVQAAAGGALLVMLGGALLSQEALQVAAGRKRGRGGEAG